MAKTNIHTGFTLKSKGDSIMNNNHIQLSFPTELCSYLISGSNPKVSEVCFRIFLSQRMPNTTAIVVDFANSKSMQAMLQQFFPTASSVTSSPAR